MKKDPYLIGLYQALGVVAYTFLIGNLVFFLEKTAVTPPDYLGFTLILALFVFSAAITGSIIFGYSGYLAFNKKTKEALSVLGFTLLYGLGLIGIIIVILGLFI